MDKIRIYSSRIGIREGEMTNWQVVLQNPMKGYTALSRLKKMEENVCFFLGGQSGFVNVFVQVWYTCIELKYSLYSYSFILSTPPTPAHFSL